jgi:hypothetical protein
MILPATLSLLMDTSSRSLPSLRPQTHHPQPRPSSHRTDRAPLPSHCPRPVGHTQPPPSCEPGQPTTLRPHTSERRHPPDLCPTPRHSTTRPTRHHSRHHPARPPRTTHAPPPPLATTPTPDSPDLAQTGCRHLTPWTLGPSFTTYDHLRHQASWKILQSPI